MIILITGHAYSKIGLTNDLLEISLSLLSTVHLRRPNTFLALFTVSYCLFHLLFIVACFAF